MVSQLDLISQQQGMAKEALADNPSRVEYLSEAKIEPAESGVRCSSLAAAHPAIPLYRAGVRNIPLGADDFLASRRLEVRKTLFDQAWYRVSHASLQTGTASKLVGLRAGTPTQAKLRAVNAWANTRIRYAEDRDLYGRADYWANAGNTLRRRAGDCEDIAILKMQMLAGMGIPRSDMYLTIARDLARNSDHALLIVKSGGQSWLLDNSTNELLDASQSYDYRPIMSFSGSHAWLHGY